jgi:hypothetical protein
MMILKTPARAKATFLNGSGFFHVFNTFITIWALVSYSINAHGRREGI